MLPARYPLELRRPLLGRQRAHVARVVAHDQDRAAVDPVIDRSDHQRLVGVCRAAFEPGQATLLAHFMDAVGADPLLAGRQVRGADRELWQDLQSGC